MPPKRLTGSGFAIFLVLMTYQNPLLPPPFIFYPFLKTVLFQVTYTDLLDHKGHSTGARTLDDCKHDLTENTEAVWVLSTEIWCLCGNRKKVKRLFQEKMRGSEYLKTFLLSSFFLKMHHIISHYMTEMKTSNLFLQISHNDLCDLCSWRWKCLI